MMNSTIDLDARSRLGADRRCCRSAAAGPRALGPASGGLWEVGALGRGRAARRRCASPTRSCLASGSIAAGSCTRVDHFRRGRQGGDPLHLRRRRLRALGDDPADPAHAARRDAGHFGRRAVQLRAPRPPRRTIAPRSLRLSFTKRGLMTVVYRVGALSSLRASSPTWAALPSRHWAALSFRSALSALRGAKGRHALLLRQGRLCRADRRAGRDHRAPLSRLGRAARLAAAGVGAVDDLALRRNPRRRERRAAVARHLLVLPAVDPDVPDHPAACCARASASPRR